MFNNGDSLIDGLSSVFIVIAVYHILCNSFVQNNSALCFNSKNVCSTVIKLIYILKIKIDMH